MEKMDQDDDERALWEVMPTDDGQVTQCDRLTMMK
jgi:hypothetical protein